MLRRAEELELHLAGRRHLVDAEVVNARSTACGRGAEAGTGSVQILAGVVGRDCRRALIGLTRTMQRRNHSARASGREGERERRAILDVRRNEHFRRSERVRIGLRAGRGVATVGRDRVRAHQRRKVDLVLRIAIELLHGRTLEVTESLTIRVDVRCAITIVIELIADLHASLTRGRARSARAVSLANVRTTRAHTRSAAFAKVQVGLIGRTVAVVILSVAGLIRGLVVGRARSARAVSLADVRTIRACTDTAAGA